MMIGIPDEKRKEGNRLYSIKKKKWQHRQGKGLAKSDEMTLESGKRKKDHCDIQKDRNTTN